MPVELVCEVCGKTFNVKPSRVKNRHTCSRECSGKRHSKIMMGHPYYGGHQYQKGHPVYGGFETRWTKENHPEPWNRGLKGKSGVVLSEETRRKIGDANRGKKRPDLTSMNRDPDFMKKRMKGLHNGLTKPEKTVLNVIEKNNLPFKYVGDGEEIVGTFNPDFIHKEARKVIEVFGRAFHDPEASFFTIDWKRQPEGRREVFKQHGYECLILWDDELDSEDFILSSINEFAVGNVDVDLNASVDNVDGQISGTEA